MRVRLSKYCGNENDCLFDEFVFCHCWLGASWGSFTPEDLLID